MADADPVIAVDENDKEIGLISRAQAHKEGILHRISVVYLLAAKGNILVQERADGRYDHSSAGHVDPGETYLDAANRELFEELGVSLVPLEKIAKGASSESDIEKGTNIRHVFEIFAAYAEPKTLLETEVKNVFWDSPRRILEEMKDANNNSLYAGGFRASLPLFMEAYRDRLVP